MDFREADRRWADLKRRYDNGSLSDKEFDTQLEQIMVQGTGDRWWAKSRETGEWHYSDDGGGTWVRSAPPGYHRDPGPDEPITQTNWMRIAWAVLLSGAIPLLLNFFLPQNLFGVFEIGSVSSSGAFILFHLVPLAFGYWAGRTWPGNHLQAYAVLGLLAGFVELVISWGITLITPFWTVAFFDYLLALLTAILFAAGAYFAGSTQER